MQLSRIAEAEEVYGNALLLYQQERDPMGQAYTLTELIRCCHRLHGHDHENLTTLATQALSWAAACRVESVTHYVMDALREVFGKDSEKLRKLLDVIDNGK